MINDERPGGKPSGQKRAAETTPTREEELRQIRNTQTTDPDGAGCSSRFYPGEGEYYPSYVRAGSGE